jgi:hypothetical protein
MFKKSFSYPIKLISLVLIISCSILFTELAKTQPKDSQGGSTTEEKDNSENSKNFIYLGIAAVLVVGAIYLLVTNKSDKDKKTESEINTNTKDSTAINKTDTTRIKK